MSQNNAEIKLFHLDFRFLKFFPVSLLDFRLLGFLVWCLGGWMLGQYAWMLALYDRMSV
jgi:hypothetical protein